MERILNTEKSRIFCTKDYSLFSLPEFFKVSKVHMNRVKKSIISNNLMEDHPILVSKSFEILDGKYRFLSCYELGIEIFYFFAESTTIDDEVRLKGMHRDMPIEQIISAYSHKPQYSTLNDVYRLYNGSIDLKNIIRTILWTKEKYIYDFRVGNFKSWSIDDFIMKVNRIKYVMSYFGITYYDAWVLCVDLIGRNDNESHLPKHLWPKLRDYKRDNNVLGRNLKGIFEKIKYSIDSAKNSYEKLGYVYEQDFKFLYNIGIRIKSKILPEHLRFNDLPDTEKVKHLIPEKDFVLLYTN